MKTYRLNRDWSVFGKGTLFKKSDDGGSLYTLDSNNGVLASVPDDYLDEQKESHAWHPDEHETYYFIRDDGVVGADDFNQHDAVDGSRLRIGNCLKTEDETYDVLAWLKARQRLIESGARFINSRDVDIDGECFIVYFDVSGEKLTIEDILLDEHSVYQKRLYFLNEDVAERSIRDYRSDWLTYLGVKGSDDQD